MTEYVEQLSYSELVIWCAAILGGLISVSTGVGFLLEARLGSKRRIFDLPLAEGQLRWELIGTLRFLLMGTFAFAGLIWAVPLADESALSIATTFFVCWAGFEIYYWCLHRAMHFKPFYRFHRRHHDSRVTSPLTGYSMSTVESVGWLVGLIGVPLLLSIATPISLVGLLAYHTLYQVPGNIIGHANVDFFPAASEKRSNSWISHPITYHSLHHARFINHYSFGSSFMDRLLGTEWPDWPELHARVIRGEPLEKLSVRGSAWQTAEKAVA
jgi:sterol desaturase/sphingolipid hydroxylase (fatty acid hydroxylase superfamily)